MWSKKSIFLLFLLPLFVFGAETQKKDGEKKENKVVPMTEKEKKALLRELSIAASRFNPRRPGLTVAHVQKVLLKDIFDPLLDKKIPDEPGKVKKSADTITYLGTRMALFKYDVLLKNPELPEVTGIKEVWYKAYRERLKKMEELAKKLDQVSVNGNLEKYALVKGEIEAYQKVLKEFADGKKPKLSSDETRAIRRRNMLWRVSVFKKQQAETLKKAGITPSEWQKAAPDRPDEKRPPKRKPPVRKKRPARNNW